MKNKLLKIFSYILGLMIIYSNKDVYCMMSGESVEEPIELENSVETSVSTPVDNVVDTTIVINTSESLQEEPDVISEIADKNELILDTEEESLVEKPKTVDSLEIPAPRNPAIIEKYFEKKPEHYEADANILSNYEEEILIAPSDPLADLAKSSIIIGDKQLASDVHEKYKEHKVYYDRETDTYKQPPVVYVEGVATTLGKKQHLQKLQQLVTLNGHLVNAQEHLEDIKESKSSSISDQQKQQIIQRQENYMKSIIQEKQKLIATPIVITENEYASAISEIQEKKQKLARSNSVNPEKTDTENQVESPKDNVVPTVSDLVNIINEIAIQETQEKEEKIKRVLEQAKEEEEKINQSAIDKMLKEDMMKKALEQAKQKEEDMINQAAIDKMLNDDIKEEDLSNENTIPSHKNVQEGNQSENLEVPEEPVLDEAQLKANYQKALSEKNSEKTVKATTALRDFYANLYKGLDLETKKRIFAERRAQVDSLVNDVEQRKILITQEQELQLKKEAQLMAEREKEFLEAHFQGDSEAHILAPTHSQILADIEEREKKYTEVLEKLNNEEIVLERKTSLLATSEDIKRAYTDFFDMSKKAREETIRLWTEYSKTPVAKILTTCITVTIVGYVAIKTGFAKFIFSKIAALPQKLFAKQATTTVTGTVINKIEETVTSYTQNPGEIKNVAKGAAGATAAGIVLKKIKIFIKYILRR